MIKVLVFDFDGVILESVGVKDQAVYKLFDDATLDERQQVLELHRRSPGIRRSDRIAMLLAQGLRREARPEKVDFYLKVFADLVWDGLIACSEVPGVRSFLENNSPNIPCYVVSAAPQEEVRSIAISRDFSRFFKVILGGPSTKVDNLTKIKYTENVQSHNILFFGDKISDFEAANLIGARFVARVSKESQNNFPDNVIQICDFLRFNHAYI